MNLLLNETGMGSWSILIIFVVILAVMIIPQYIRSKKENTKRQETMNQLKAGDSIITNAGVFGIVRTIFTALPNFSSSHARVFPGAIVMIT